MKKLTITFAALGLLCSSAVAAETSSAPQQPAYGYSIVNDLGIMEFGLTNFSPEMVFPQESTISAGAFAEGKYYAMKADENGNPTGLFEFDMETGESTLINPMENAPSLLTDMTYDYTTQTLYALADNWPQTNLVSISLPSGELSVIANIDKLLYAIAADANGDLYTIDGTATIHRIDKETHQLELVKEDRMYINGLQSFDFDMNTGKLYWLTTNYGQCSLYEITPGSWDKKKIGTVDGYQISGLYTGYTTAGPSAPGQPKNLTITPAQGGILSCTLTWDNPTTTFDRQPLSSILSISVYRDGELIGTATDETAVGQSASFTDDNAPSGLHTYKIAATNSEGEGMFSLASAFVGEDRASAPTNVTATAIDASSIKIQWEAPTKGIYGGWINNEQMTYRIVRLNDNKTVAESCDETEFTDHIDGAYAGYSYSVTPITPAGEGESARSNAATAGTVQNLPVSCAFTNENDIASNGWSVFDEDGNGKCWVIAHELESASTIGAETYFVGGTDSDDWLISPPAHISAGKFMSVSFNVRTAYYPEETLEIYIGKGSTPADMTQLVATIKARDYYYNPGEIKELISPVDADGEYRIAIRYASPKDTPNAYGVHINDFEWKEQDYGTVTGTVTASDGSPIYGAIVSAGSYKATTAYDGSYTLDEIKQGNYLISATATGYTSSEKNVEIAPGAEIDLDFTLDALPRYAVAGKISDTNGNPIAGASISLSGYAPFSTSSTADGTFEIKDVYGEQTYTLNIRKNNYQPQTAEITPTGNLTGDYTLNCDNLPPYMVTATETETGIHAEWIAPKTLAERSYDNGNPSDLMGYDEGGENHVLGTVYRTPGTVYEVKWMTLAYEGKSDHVNIFLFDLDYGGYPTNEILFSAKGVKTVDGEWNTLVLPEAVNAPKGFLLAISGEGNVALALDNGTEDGTIAYPQTQCFNTDYTAAYAYRYLDETSSPSRRFLLRAVCEEIEPDNSTSPAISYNVWRLPADAENSDEQNWTPVGTNITATEIDDAGMTSGKYIYAVKAIYPAESLTSEATFSEATPFNMNADLTVNVTANSDNAHAEGAKVTLSGTTGQHQASVAEGKAEFSGIGKGTYSVSVEQTGFKTIEANDVAITGEDRTFTLAYELEQKLDKAHNIDILPTENPNSWELVWNVQPNIFDDFDGDDHEDFMLNPAGSAGWQYIDNDQFPTYGFGRTEFPNMRSPMAAITFNSSETTPPLGIETAYSGIRSLAFFAALESENEGGEVILHDSDDYLISPELSPYKDFTFSFWARSYEESVGYLERIRAGYSTTTPDIESFIWLDEDFFYVPTEYQQYTYSIPADAKYVVLNNHSISNFMLLVDDIFIGVEGQKTGNSYLPVNVERYKVYLDGTLYTETTDKNCLLENIGAGEHTAAIVQVFATGESEKLEIRFNGNAGTQTLNTAGIRAHVEHRHLHINGDYCKATLFNAAGNPVLHLNGERSTDLNSFADGIYILRITTTDGETSVQKVIVD